MPFVANQANSIEHQQQQNKEATTTIIIEESQSNQELATTTRPSNCNRWVKTHNILHNKNGLLFVLFFLCVTVFVVSKTNCVIAINHRYIRLAYFCANCHCKYWKNIYAPISIAASHIVQLHSHLPTQIHTHNFRVRLSLCLFVCFVTCKSISINEKLKMYMNFLFVIFQHRYRPLVEQPT